MNREILVEQAINKRTGKVYQFASLTKEQHKKEGTANFWQFPEVVHVFQFMEVII